MSINEPLSPEINGKIEKQLHLPTWREMNWDTAPEAEAILFDVWRKTPAWRKLEMMEALNHTARELAMAGLRRRYPDATPKEFKYQLAIMLLGKPLANRAYGHLLD